MLSTLFCSSMYSFMSHYNETNFTGGGFISAMFITYVSYDELSPYLVQAAVATEDARFYKHSGIDMKGLARVLVKTLMMRDSSQGGGSTITQQLAKTLYPRSEINNKFQMVFTKLKEWITAVKIERDYTKNEIVDMYLNSIFFGSSAYGVKAAAETYFAKEPADLTVEEAALLVGMVNKPTRYIRERVQHRAFQDVATDEEDSF